MATENEETTVEESGHDQLQADLALRRLEAEQNLPLGILAGAVAAVVGAVIWAAVTVATGYQIGWMAVGVGFLVAMAVRYAGRGVTQIFSIAGASLALLGCVLGNLLTVVVFVAAEWEVTYFEAFAELSLDTMRMLLVETFSPIDLLFYGIAVYEGYQLSLREPGEAPVA